MKSFEKKDSLMKNREVALKKFKKKKENQTINKKKNVGAFRQMD